MSDRELTADDIAFRSNTAARFATAAAATPHLRDTLQRIEQFIKKFVVVTADQATIVTLWVAHTHAIEAADCTPYLQITSATKRAGKTRLLEVLEPLVARPWLTGRTSAAVLVRKTDAEQPTLELDESDTAFNGEKEYAEALRGILNSGYRRSGKASLCVGQGANLTYRDFKTFGAKAIAGIGALPSTIADRAIAIQLRRRKQDEPVARWRQRDGHSEATPLHEQLVAWAACEATIEELRQARPAVPALADDRKAEVLEPLFAIAEHAGGSWPKRAQKAALNLTGAVEDPDIVVELLRDVATIVAGPHESPVLPTKEFIAALTALEDRPWATWRKDDKPITGQGLARLLGPLDIHPTPLERLRGYRWDAFDDAIARYLPSISPGTGSQPSVRQNPNKNGPESRISNRQPQSPADGLKSEDQARFHWGSDGLTHRTPDPGNSPPEQQHSPEDEVAIVERRIEDNEARFRRGWR